MGKFSGVLLATDYDDTLYSSDCTISQENRQAIARFVAEGGLFCISTGRSYINFAIQMERERLPVNTPVILSNGASIYDFATEESLWLKYLPAQAPVHLAQVCAAFPQVGFEAYHQDEVYIFRPNEVTQRHLTRCHLTGRPKACLLYTSEKLGDNVSNIDCLSMGMSGDYPLAIAGGSTMVRVGTCLLYTSRCV